MSARPVMLDAWMVRTIEGLDKALRLGVQNENNVALLIEARVLRVMAQQRALCF
jgi:hypothetical protein